jgi:hypothetical protein
MFRIEHRFDFERLASNHVPEGLTFQQLHGDERPSWVFLSSIA